MKNIKVLKENYALSAKPTTIVALIDGENSRNFDQLYQNFATALHFPEHFGKNLDALYDMLCDLNWLEEKGFENVHLVIRNYDAMLSDIDKDEKLGLLSVLRDTAEEWHWLEAEEKCVDFTLYVEPATTWKKDLKEI
jgi:RNAse (barnase) inhibitor barstar